MPSQTGVNEFAAGARLYLDELSHRTLNNYASTVAAVQICARSMKDPAGRRTLDRLVLKLSAAAETHKALLSPVHDVDRRLDEDLERLCAALAASILADEGVSLTLACEPLVMPARDSWLVCLIVSELVMNSAKHAFRGRDGGAVTVDVRALGAVLCCVVSDDGCASPGEAGEGRGSRILDALAGELGGVIWRRHETSGSRVGLAAPLRAAPLAPRRDP